MHSGKLKTRGAAPLMRVITIMKPSSYLGPRAITVYVKIWSALLKEIGCRIAEFRRYIEVELPSSLVLPEAVITMTRNKPLRRDISEEADPMP